MKKAAIISLVSVLVVGCIVALVMSNSIERKIVGTWEVVNEEGHYIEFEKGELTFYEGNEEVGNGHYRIDEKNHLMVWVFYDPYYDVDINYTYKDGRLYLSANDEELTLKKVGS